MSNLRELYQQVIIDHGRRPKNFRACETSNYIKQGYNPLCGDKLTVYLTEKNGVVQDASFIGKGCTISMASASLMTESIKGKTIEETMRLFSAFHQLVTDDKSLAIDLGKLSVLAGVKEFPLRVKCATLAWHTLKAAIENEADEVTTE